MENEALFIKAGLFLIKSHIGMLPVWLLPIE